MHSVHIWPFRNLLGDGLPLALHVDASIGVRVGATLRGGTTVDERRLARLIGALASATI
jgi:hypothetical protein